TEGHGRKAAIIVVIDSCARQTRVAKSLIRVAGPTVLGQATSALGIAFGHLALGATRASPIDQGVIVGLAERAGRARAEQAVVALVVSESAGAAAGFGRITRGAERSGLGLVIVVVAATATKAA